MQQRKLGRQSLTVSCLGLGCMGMTWAYGTDRNEAEAIATIHEAIDLGVNFLDTAEVYGPFTNEELVGKAAKGRRDRVVIATKFGFVFDESGRITAADSRPDHIREVVNASLNRLQTDYIDLLYQHRVDPAVPIEEVVGTMAEFVRAGKVRYLGLSEAGPTTLRRATKVHPISALQSEFSLFERGVEAEVLPACRELGIGFVPYSPLGRGFITGQVKRAEDYAADNDNRKNMPRFQGENFDRNMRRAEAVRALAAKRGITPGQIALAWLLDRGEDIVPIPGTKRRTYLRENVAAANVRLTDEDRKYLDESLPPVSGPRYSDQAMKMIDRG
ncbi:MAG TPA: aldo/keto reductase [Gemmataceae bacterium]|nr:aldo/keto reductase [Gemmataceae bacterium]